ncbi:MAG: PASTA domain-containing protein [Rectinemataceae bacterium]
MKLKFRFPAISKLSRIRDIRFPSIPLDLHKLEDLDREHYRIAAYALAAVIVLMVVAGVTAFFLSLRGAEETMVPDVRGMELTQALIRMQDKELYPRIALRFTDDPLDRGKIVDQSPVAGTIVKAGRRIQLVVSRGAIADRVENFVGQDIDEVRIHLQTLFATARPLLTINDPPVYLYDKSPAGTILAQKPAPGTELGGATLLELVVSRGPQRAQVKVPALLGLSIDDALAVVEGSSVDINFAMRDPMKNEKPGVVVSEFPSAGSLIPPASSIAVTVTTPGAQKGMASGIFSRQLPQYPYPLKVSLDVISPMGERTPLLTVRHPGGLFTAPYNLPVGSMLVLSVLDREVPPRVEVGTQ